MQGWTSSVSRGFHAKSRPHNLLHEWFLKFYCPINFSHYGAKVYMRCTKLIRNLIGLGKMFAHQMLHYLFHILYHEKVLLIADLQF